MASAETASSSGHGESGSVSESSALLQKDVQVAVDVSVTAEPGHFVPLALKDASSCSSLIQVFEDVICEDYYQQPPASNGSASSTPPLADRCKAQAVQKELALVRGFQQLVPVFAALLCTVPYGLLAERIGRRRVLVLSGAGVFAALSWVLAVCYWRFASIRWVWLSGVFLFIGGGDAVTSSIVHVMVTDATDRAEHAQIFLYLHAADVISGFFGPAISAALMEKGHAWTVLLIAEGVLFSGTFLLTRLIPETLNLREESSGSADPTSGPTSPRISVASSRRSASSSPTKIAISIVAGVSSLLAPLIGVLASNRQALLLLCIFAPQSAARELFTMIGLQYSRAKYSLSYARGNVLLSLFQAAQGVVVLVLLPLITRLIADPRGWTAWARDRLYAIVSIAVTACGLMVIAVAPGLAIEATGLLLVALGSCTTGLLMSLLGGAVRPSQVSAVYSAALMLSIVVRSVVGPAVNALLVKGLELGWIWMGLPFAVMSVLIAGVVVASGFIRTEREDFHEE
ncbi:MAG: hypothetical protein M1819_002395 [Sarea resinae]|nr:MAG: hypothetical protein M1819_002395 [Sarea resinae]